MSFGVEAGTYRHAAGMSAWLAPEWRESVTSPAPRAASSGARRGGERGEAEPGSVNE
ncbi:MAG TPA: hypothetical protein VIQ60_13010 [Gemmatimonadaceae bacterium]